MPVVLPQGKQQFFDANGDPAVGWKLYTYVPLTSTPKDTYTDYTGGTENTNPVVMDARGEASIYWSGNYDVVLKTAADVTVWGPQRLNNVADELGDAADPTLGDALVGVERTLTGAVETTEHVVNEWRIVNVVSDFGADPTNVADSKAAIQAAIDSGRDIFIPAGTYKIASALTIPTGRKSLTIRGEGMMTKLEATFAGAIINFPSGQTTRYIHIDKITFQASGAGDGTATGISGNAGLAYVLLSDITNCQFGGSLRYGIYGNFLQCEVNRCGFASEQVVSGTFKAIRMFATDVFQTTIRIINCEFNLGNDDYVCEFSWGTDLLIQGGAIEGNAPTTGVIKLVDWNMAYIRNLWAETNGAVPLVKCVDGANSPVENKVFFHECHLEGHGSGANDCLLDVTSSTGKHWGITESLLVNWTHVYQDGAGVYDNQARILIRYGNKSFNAPTSHLERQGLNRYAGTLTDDSAVAGDIGEYVVGSQTTPTNFPATTTYGDGASVALEAGDWDIDAALFANLNGATFTGQPTIGVSTTSGNASTGLVPGDTTNVAPVPTSTLNSSCHVNAARFSLGVATTVYLKVRADYSAGNPQYRCRISARRRR